MVLGGEGRGLAAPHARYCATSSSAFPMVGAVQSLNVSVAAGIVLFELLRQSPPR